MNRLTDLSHAPPTPAPVLTVAYTPLTRIGPNGGSSSFSRRMPVHGSAVSTPNCSAVRSSGASASSRCAPSSTSWTRSSSRPRPSRDVWITVASPWRTTRSAWRAIAGGGFWRDRRPRCARNRGRRSRSAGSDPAPGAGLAEEHIEPDTWTRSRAALRTGAATLAELTEKESFHGRSEPGHVRASAAKQLGGVATTRSHP